MEFEQNQTDQELIYDIDIELERVAKRIVYLLDLRKTIQERTDEQ